MRNPETMTELEIIIIDKLRQAQCEYDNYRSQHRDEMVKALMHAKRVTINALRGVLMDYGWGTVELDEILFPGEA